MTKTTTPRWMPAISLSKLPILVVGGGKIGRRRLLRLLQSQALITLVSPGPEDTASWLAKHDPQNQVTWHARSFQPADLQGHQLVLACTHDEDLNENICKLSQQLGILYNQASSAQHSQVHMTAELSRGPIQLATYAGGAPTVSRALKARQEGDLGHAWAAMASLAADLRAIMRAQDLPAHERRARIKTWTAPALLAMLARADWAQVQAWTQQHLGFSPPIDQLKESAQTEASGQTPCLVISSFGPFPGVPINPTQEVADRLQARLQARHPDQRVVHVRLPTHFGGAWETLETHLEQIMSNPALHLSAVLSLGVSNKLKHIALERIAMNYVRGGRKDASGAVTSPQGGPLIPFGPDGLATRLPLESLEASLRDKGWSVECSNSAGTYVCNEVFYKLMHWCNRRAWLGPAGFVHIPPTPGKAAMGEVVGPLEDLLLQVAPIQTRQVS